MEHGRYERYVPSGVEWLGEVPEHWVVAAIKHRYRLVGGTTPKSADESYWGDEVPWATPTDLGKLPAMRLGKTKRSLTRDGFASCGLEMVPAGSIILSTRAPIGSLGIADVPVCTNQGCKSLVPKDSECSRYMAHLLSVTGDELNIRGSGSTFLELSADALGAFRVPLPPLGEQRAIAGFLDAETGKIDALVAVLGGGSSPSGDQRTLRSLLAERRAALISAAVTGKIKVPGV